MLVVNKNQPLEKPSKKIGLKMPGFFGSFGCFPKRAGLWWWMRENSKNGRKVSRYQFPVARKTQNLHLDSAGRVALVEKILGY
jgi:hypothetical protein